MVSQVTSVSVKDQHHHDVVDLHFLLGLFKARKWLVIILITICVTLGAVYALTRPAIYQSTALIKINMDTAANASNLATALGMSGAGSAGGVMNATPAQVETVLLQSHYILEQVADDLGLSITITPKYFPLVGHLWATLFSSTDPQGIHISRFHAPPSLQSIPLLLSRKK
ncbi:MAG: Wzz/FepE/Etk N-terminal domain-containing protein [Gammaproteobacteria bacterium]|nr:Wzz/FepE/Etk N-terminal domain-containing protein [Gammaproteobacteria bacterium]